MAAMEDEEDEAMANRQDSLDLGQLFSAALGTLQQHKTQLNQADDYNHDHGDNMVDTFSAITRAVKQKPQSTPSEQLASAAGSLRRSNSGSAQVYAKGLSQASREFQGRQVTKDNAMNLIQALMGGGQQGQQQPTQQSSGGLGDLLGGMLGGQQGQQQPAQQSSGGLGDLLGGMLGGQQGQQQPTQQSSGGLGDLLGGMLGGQQGQQQPAQQSSGGLGDLLGGMLGGQQGQQQQPQSQQDNGIDSGDLLKAGLAFMSTRARGGSNLEAVVNAVVAAGAMGSGYRQQSSSLVVGSLLSAVQNMTSGK